MAKKFIWIIGIVFLLSLVILCKSAAADVFNVTYEVDDEIDNSDYTPYWNVTLDQAGASITEDAQNLTVQIVDGGTSRTSTARAFTNGTTPINYDYNDTDVYLKFGANLYYNVGNCGGVSGYLYSRFGLTNGSSTVWLKTIQDDCQAAQSSTDNSTWEVFIDGETDLVDVYDDEILDTGNINISSIQGGDNIYFVIDASSTISNAITPKTARTTLYYLYSRADPESLNISDTQPSNQTSFITDTTLIVNYNLTVNSTKNFNCSLYFDDVLNQTQNYSAGSNVFVGFNVTYTKVDTTFDYYISCRNTDNFTKTSAAKEISIYFLTLGTCDEGTLIANFTLIAEDTRLQISDSNTFNLETDIIIYTSNGIELIAYHNSTNTSNIQICFSHNITATYLIDIIASYSSSGYVTEFWYLDNGTLDNGTSLNSHTTKQIDLYDLPLADSTSFLFIFTDANELPVDDAIIHTFRYYIGTGTYYEVERSRQDDNGQTHVHLVEEDVIYYFVVSQYGNIIYTSSEYNAKCISTPCQIELSASEDFTAFENDYITIDGTHYSLTSNRTSRMVYLTYLSNASDLINFSLYQYNNNEPTLINTTSITAITETLQLHIPLIYGNATYFVAIHKNNNFVQSQWIDFSPSARDYFGGAGAIMGGVMLLALGFMALSEGVVLIVITCAALFLMGVMVIIDTSWLAIISFICAGGILIWKISKREK